MTFISNEEFINEIETSYNINNVTMVIAWPIQNIIIDLNVNSASCYNVEWCLR